MGPKSIPKRIKIEVDFQERKNTLQDRLGKSWSHLGPIWGHLDRAWGHLGAILGRLGEPETGLVIFASIIFAKSKF